MCILIFPDAHSKPNPLKSGGTLYSYFWFEFYCHLKHISRYPGTEHQGQHHREGRVGILAQLRLRFIISEYAHLRGKTAQTNLVPPALSALVCNYSSLFSLLNSYIHLILPAKQLNTFRKLFGKYNF